MTPDVDFADVAVEQWRQVRPDLDFSAMGPIARFGRLGVLAGRLVDRVFVAHGMDRGEFDVLASLRRSGVPFALTPSHLAEVLLISRAGMTKRVDRLAARGLVRRDDQAHDRRSRLITLTDLGRDLVDRVVTEHTVNESRLLATVPADELEIFDRVLRRLLTTVSSQDEDRSEPATGSSLSPHSER